MNGVRYGEYGWEGRCDACLEYLPLDSDTRDLWPVKGRGFRICRDCDNLKTKARMQARRKDQAIREADRARCRAYYASMTPEERRALKRSHVVDLDRQRAYMRTYMRARRARQREEDAA